MTLLRNRPMTGRAVRLVSVAGLLSGCAGGTFRSGVGDTYLQEPPYYAGRGLAGDTGRIAYLPITYQRGGVHSPMFDPEGGPGTAVAALLTEMNAYLDSLGVAARVELSTPLRGLAPNVIFDCAVEPTNECEVGDVSKPRMRLAVARPDGNWIASASAALDRTGASRVLLITLEGAQYWVRQTNWRGSKAVELGTDYTVPVPWLTSLDDPVSVLQLTGAVIGPDGRAIRIGAEGLLARRTNLLLSAVGAQALITDEDVETLRTARREDVPGQPLVWQAALRNLVGQLTGR